MHGKFSPTGYIYYIMRKVVEYSQKIFRFLIWVPWMLKKRIAKT